MLTIYTKSELDNELKINNNRISYVIAYPIVNPVKKIGNVYIEFRLLTDELNYDRICMNIPDKQKMELWKRIIYESYINRISEIALHS